MLTRIITAILLGIFILAPAVIFSNTIVLPIICGLLCTVGIYEIIKCFKQNNSYLIQVPSMIIGICMPILVRYTAFDNGIFIIAVLIAIYVFYMFSLTVFSNNEISIDEVSKTVVMTVYISIGFSSIILLRDLPNGQYLFILTFLSAWITDIFAYFTGMFCGKHKLSPIISPKKTIEGSIGGTLFCTAAFVGYSFLLKSFFNLEVNPLLFGVIGLFASIVSQLGDLVASAAKRKYGTKDYGTIFPGHGGVLDRFDSIIAVAPVLYLLCFVFTN